MTYGLTSALVASHSDAAREPNQSSSDLCDSAGSYIRGGGRLFLAADGRRVALFGAETAPNRVRGKGRGRTEGQFSLSPYGTAPSEMEPKTFDKPLFIFFPTKGKSLFTVFPTRRKSVLQNSYNSRKIGAKKCRRLNKPVSEYRSRIVHTVRTLRDRLMTHTVLIRADFDKRRFT